MNRWHRVRFFLCALAGLAGVHAHAATYTFADTGTPPLSCTRTTAGNYSCPATSLQYGDSIVVTGTRPATLNFAGDLNLSSVSINASGAAADLHLVVNGRLRFTNYAPLVNAHVTAQSVCDDSANCGAVRYGGNLTATAGPVVLGYGANVPGVVVSAGDVTVDTLTIGTPGYTGDAVRAGGRLTFNNSAAVFHGHLNVGALACSGSTCSQRVNGNVVVQSGGVTLGYGAVVTGAISARGTGAFVALDRVSVGTAGATGTAIDTSGPLTFTNTGATVIGNIYAASLVGSQSEVLQGHVTLGTTAGIQLGYGAEVRGCVKAPQSTSPPSIRLGQANSIGAVCCVQADNSCQNTCVSGAASMPPLCAGPPPSSSDIVVNARGTPVDGVYPNMEVWVNGTRLGGVAVSSETGADHSFSAVLPGSGNLSIDVVFTNDAYKPPQDRNLFVNSVTVRGRTLLPTDPGVVLQQPYFRYGTVSNVAAGQVTLASNGALRFNTQPLIVGSCYSGVAGYGSIAQAIQAAQADDTITICPGTYSEALTVDKSLTLRARTSTRDVTVNGGAAPAITFANNAALRSFTSSYIGFTSTGNAAYANFINGVNTTYSFIGSAFTSTGTALHMGNANPGLVYLNTCAVSSASDMGVQVGSNNAGPVRISGGTVSSRSTGILVGGGYSAIVQHQFAGGLVVDTSAGSNATGVDVRSGYVYANQLAVRSSGVGLNHDAGHSVSNQILDSSFYTAGHGIQSSVNVQGGHEFRNVYIRASGSGARGLSVSGGSVFSQLDIESDGDAIYIDRTHGRSQTYGLLRLRSASGAGISLNTSGATIGGSLVFGSTGNPIAIEARTYGIQVNDSMATTGSQVYNNLSISSEGYGIRSGDNMAGQMLVGSTDPVTLTVTASANDRWALWVRRASALTVNRLAVESTRGGVLLDSNVNGSVVLQGRVTEPLRLATSGNGDHALRLDNSGGAAVIDQVVLSAPSGYGLRASSNATVAQLSNFNIQSRREAIRIKAPTVNFTLRDGYARTTGNESDAVLLDDEGSCSSGEHVISRVTVSSAGNDAALTVKCARTVTVDRLCAMGGDEAAYFDSNAGRVLIGNSVFSGHRDEGVYLKSRTSGGGVTDSCFLTATRPMAYFPDDRSQTFDRNFWQGVRTAEYRPNDDDNGVWDRQVRSSCHLDTVAMCNLPADAVRIARFQLEETSAYTGAAGEVKDTGGYSGGPFHGKAAGQPLPALSGERPARSGNPGTCGYLEMPGLQNRGGRIELGRLPVSVAAGAQTSVAFWMKWDGADNVMPIGWGQHDLWLVGGHFGFNTGNGDVYGVASAGLANRWVHVVAVFTNGGVNANRLYIDGVPQGLVQRQGSPWLPGATVQSTLFVGGWGADEGYRFQGQVDEVQVFNGAVNQTQVNALFNETHACVSSGPVAEWRMDDLQWNGTVGEVRDSSPTGAHGTARSYAGFTDQKVPTPATGGKVCGRGDFRDPFNHVDVSHPTIDNLSGPFTVMGWVMMNDYSSYQYIFSNARDCCGAYRGIELMARYGGSRPYFQVWFADGRQAAVQSSVSIATQTWVHVAGTWDGTSLRIYVNGVLAGSSSAAAGKTFSGPSSFRSTLGAMGHSQGYYNLNGYLDEVKLWNRALPAAEIATGHAQENAGKNWDGSSRVCPTPAVLRAQYRFEDTRAYDGSVAELKDTAAAAGGPFHGKAAGTAMPVQASTAPARPGTPGTCGYVRLSGSTSQGPRFEIDNLPVALDQGAQTSVSFWMNWDGTDSVMPLGWWHHDLWLVGGSFGFNTGSGDVYGISSAGLVNRWVHVAAVFNNGSLGRNLLYINGVAQTLVQRIGSPDVRSAVVQSGLAVGGWRSGAGYRFQGLLDELKVFNGTLYPDQVQTLYTETHPCTGGAPAGLNAYDTATPVGAAAGVIQTKLAGTPFAVDVVALNTARTAVDTAFSQDVKVELLANAGVDTPVASNNCPTTATVLQTATVRLTSGRASVAWSAVADAWRDARIRISFPATGTASVVACSNDNFAIRPAQFAVAASHADRRTAGATVSLLQAAAIDSLVPSVAVHQAGQPWRLVLTAQNSQGQTTGQYAGAPVAQSLVCTLPTTGCAAGTLDLGTLTLRSGVLTSDTARYSEVGAVSVRFADAEFASVDAADGSTDAQRHVVSTLVHLGRFVPDHFDVTPHQVDAACTPATGSGFTYFGQDGPVTQQTVSALNASNQITRNYTGVLAQLNLTQYATMGWTASPLPAGVTLGQGTDLPTGSWNAGQATWTRVQHRLSKASSPVPPTTFSLYASPVDADGVTVLAPVLVAPGLLAHHGRLKLVNVQSGANLDMALQAEAQHWDGQRFVRNPLDSCTTLPRSAIGFRAYAGDLSAAEMGPGHVVGSSWTFSQGATAIRVTRPSGGDGKYRGSVDVFLNLGADAGWGAGATTEAQGLGHLQDSWDWGSATTSNPVGRITLGAERQKWVFRREMY